MDYTALLPGVKALAREAAARAGDGGALRISSKGTKDFVTQVDQGISDFLSLRLPELLPGSQFVSEEGEERALENAPYKWIVDPIDGNTNLIYGLPLYALSIGLLEGGLPVLGVVYNPASGELFSAVRGHGAFLGEKRIQVNNDDALERTLALAETDPYLDRDLNRSHKLIHAVFHEAIDYRVTGSAALDICFIACGRGGVFFTQCAKPWDYAGGSIILLEAGGAITQWDNDPLPFSGKHGVLATNTLLHQDMLDRIRTFLSTIS
jgi:myo-inositol-1(or 4)-monophosphatase